MTVLTPDFYRREKVLPIARELIGKVLYTHIGNRITAGVITETEAYAGIMDRASHAYGGRLTGRTSVMYEPGGIAYIYLCYGIHSLFNVVTGPAGIPHAVLIRSVVPFEGLALMQKRRNTQKQNLHPFTGPAKVAQALGLHYRMTGENLSGNRVWIEDRNLPIPHSLIRSTPRIGVDYAGSDALLPYRFMIENIDTFTPWKSFTSDFYP